MKTIGIVLLILSSCTMMYAQHDKIRDAFFSASGTEGINSFYEVSHESELTDAVVLCYRGVSTAMKAETVSNIPDKFRFFADGKEMIGNAVKQDWYNPEIRFLRFTVQSKVPFFLGYNSEKEEDLAVVFYALENGNEMSSLGFWNRALKWMLENGDLDDSEIKRLENIRTKWKLK